MERTNCAVIGKLSFSDQYGEKLILVLLMICEGIITDRDLSYSFLLRPLSRLARIVVGVGPAETERW